METKINVTVNVNINVGPRGSLAKFWCKACGEHFGADACCIVDNSARCCFCNSSNVGPHVSELLPVTISSLEDEVSDTHKESALLRVIVGR